MRSVDRSLPSVPPFGLDAIVLKDLRPVEYYMSMIGIYIHQLFFANDKIGIGLPAAIYEFLQLRYGGANKQFTEQVPPLPIARRRGAQTVDEIFEYLTRLYAWLICRDYRDGPNPAYDTLREQALLAELDNPITKLRDLIYGVVAFRNTQGDDWQGMTLRDRPEMLDLMTVEQVEAHEWNLTVDSPAKLDTLDSRLAKLNAARSDRANPMAGRGKMLITKAKNIDIKGSLGKGKAVLRSGKSLLNSNRRDEPS